jgi:hypothetical protein
MHLFHISSHQEAQLRSENRRLKQAHSKSPTQVGSLFPFPLFPISISMTHHLQIIIIIIIIIVIIIIIIIIIVVLNEGCKGCLPLDALAPAPADETNLVFSV